MQKIGATGDGKSAVATPDGKKPKEEVDIDSGILVAPHTGSRICQNTTSTVSKHVLLHNIHTRYEKNFVQTLYIYILPL